MHVLGAVNTLVLDYRREQIYLLPATSGTSVATCEMYVATPLMPKGSDCEPGG